MTLILILLRHHIMTTTFSCFQHCFFLDFYFGTESVQCHIMTLSADGESYDLDMISSKYLRKTQEFPEERTYRNFFIRLPKQFAMAVNAPVPHISYGWTDRQTPWPSNTSNMRNVSHCRRISKYCASSCVLHCLDIFPRAQSWNIYSHV
jgi:hypothetical protein